MRTGRAARAWAGGGQTSPAHPGGCQPGPLHLPRGTQRSSPWCSRCSAGLDRRFQGTGAFPTFVREDSDSLCPTFPLAK